MNGESMMRNLMEKTQLRKFGAKWAIVRSVSRQLAEALSPNVRTTLRSGNDRPPSAGEGVRMLSGYSARDT